MKKILTLILLNLGLFLLLGISPANAQVDQRCWTKQACIDARIKGAVPFTLTQAEALEGFYDKPDARAVCGQTLSPQGKPEQTGFCLPSYKTKTNIKFGGSDTFLHIGEFIQFMYRYGIWIMGLFAVLMIIIAGLQRLTSGGNPDSIQSSNKRIIGSVIGIIIALGSYVLLNTINPALVNLRLPQIWMINPIDLTPPYCSDLPPDKKVAEFGPSGQTIPQTAKEKLVKEKMQTSVFQENSTLNPKCGIDYMVEGAGGLTCGGTVCGRVNGKAAACYREINGKQPPLCKPGNIVGNIYNSSPTAGTIIGNIEGYVVQIEPWEWGAGTGDDGWILGGIDLEYICENGYINSNYVEASAPTITSEENKVQYYSISISDNEIDVAVSDCESKGGLRGFFLEVSMNEDDQSPNEDHVLGKSGTLAIDLGDTWPIPIVVGSDLLKAAPKNYLFQPDELKNGILLNIDTHKICDIDDKPDAKLCYKNLGY